MTWVTLGESVAGTSHRARSTPCQDAFRFGILGSFSEWLVIAVADGAGSASRADVGSTLACDEFIRAVNGSDRDVLFTRDGMVALFDKVRQALCAEAERLGVGPRELACTALVALLGPASAAFAQLGDGAIVVRNGEEYRTVFWPEHAEYVNASDFLTDDRFADQIRFESATDPIPEVAVFTDGLERVALEFAARAAHPGLFFPLFNELRRAENPESLVEPFRNFLDSDRVNERTDDDKTLVLALRHQ